MKNLRPSTSIDAGRVSRCLFLNGTHENKNEKNDTKNVEMLLKGFSNAVIEKRYLQLSCKDDDFSIKR